MPGFMPQRRTNHSLYRYGYGRRIRQYGAGEGFFLLNEGNMGSNKSTLDYYDYETGVYTKNIYAERNPGVVKELGDVGNDIQIYGNKALRRNQLLAFRRGDGRQNRQTHQSRIDPELPLRRFQG